MPLNLSTTLNALNRVNEEEQAARLAESLGLSYENLDGYPFNLDMLQLIPLETVQREGVAAYIRTQDRIRVAAVHPERDETAAFVRKLAADWDKEVEMTVVSATSMKVLVTSYLKLLQAKEVEEHALNLRRTEEDKKNYFKHIRSLADLQETASAASTTELLDVILAAAFNQGASDIHLEPGEGALTVRFRIDGVLEKVLEVPMAQHHQLTSRIKILSRMKIDGQTGTQDGRFGLQDKGINADLRVSTIPTGYGEGIVMRILRQDMQALSIAELGFSDYNQKLIEEVIRRPYGLVIVTGPTGSGKSTTLYALLKALNSSEKKIITLEDPIEYRLPGIQQSQIDAEHGFTFAEGLRGALRQDPDIVMVGEIRDPETATIALNASLTGHLVLSTLHTNNAVTAHTRFLEMGIEPFLLTGSIQAVIAQRLVRKLVPESDPVNPEFKGRLVIAEVLRPSQEFEQAVIQHRDLTSLEEIAEKGGMIPMLQDGMDKVRAGTTTESEIYRVTAA